MKCKAIELTSLNSENCIVKLGLFINYRVHWSKFSNIGDWWWISVGLTFSITFNLKSNGLIGELHARGKLAREEPHSKENLVTLHPRNVDSKVPARPHHRQTNVKMSHFLASVGAYNLIWHIHDVVNWQLSKQCIRWPVWHDHIAGSGVDPSGLPVFVKLSADKSVLFVWSHP